VDELVLYFGTFRALMPRVDNSPSGTFPFSEEILDQMFIFIFYQFKNHTNMMDFFYNQYNNIFIVTNSHERSLLCKIKSKTNKSSRSLNSLLSK
jgi:hypothetical protein